MPQLPYNLSLVPILFPHSLVFHKNFIRSILLWRTTTKKYSTNCQNLKKSQIQITNMYDHHLKSCSLVMDTVRSLPLNYNIVKTPYSIYLTLSKSLLKNTQCLEISKAINHDEKVRKLEEANQSLYSSLKKLLLHVKRKQTKF